MQLSLSGLARVLAVDMAAKRVRVEAGIGLRALYSMLDSLGLALPSIGGITEQSVAGAASTGTHGSGLSHGTIPTEIAAITLVTPPGELKEVRSGPLFEAARLSLGALGVVYAVTLQCVPRTNLKKRTWVGTLEEALSPSLRENNLHYELNYFPYTKEAQMSAANPTGEPPTRFVQESAWFNDVVINDGLFGALERIGGAVPRVMPYFMQIPPKIQGDSTSVDTWWRQLTGRSTSCRAYDVEYSIPIENTAQGVAAMLRVIEQESRANPPYFVNVPANIRFTGADPQVMLSCVSDGPRCYIDIPSFAGAPSPNRFFQRLEAELIPLGARPHWGKQCYRNPKGFHPRFPEFEAIRRELDPEDKMVNPWLNTLLTGGDFPGGA